MNLSIKTDHWLNLGIAVLATLGLSLASEPTTHLRKRPDKEADAVLNRSLKAAGGLEKLQSITSRKITGTLERHGKKVPFIRVQKAPNRFLNETRFPRPGTLKQGYDGHKGWIEHPLQGGRLLQGKELAALANGAPIHPLLNYRETFPVRRFLGQVDLKGKRYQKLSLGRDTTSTKETWFFDLQSGLLAQVHTQIDGGRHGSIPVITSFEDYQEHQGVMIPHRIRTKLPTIETSLHIETVEQNASYDDSIFQPSF